MVAFLFFPALFGMNIFSFGSCFSRQFPAVIFWGRSPNLMLYHHGNPMKIHGFSRFIIIFPMNISIFMVFKTPT